VSYFKRVLLLQDQQRSRRSGGEACDQGSDGDGDGDGGDQLIASRVSLLNPPSECRFGYITRADYAPF
jgi:hypothetical protein